MRFEVQLFDGSEPVSSPGRIFGIDPGDPGAPGAPATHADLFLDDVRDPAGRWRVNLWGMHLFEDGWCHATAMVFDRHGQPVGMAQPIAFYARVWIYPSVIPWAPNPTDWQGVPHRIVLTVRAVAE